MHTQQITVRELEEHWGAVSKLAPGESMGGIPNYRLPLWEDLCSKLAWQLHLAETGYFSRKRHGYTGVYRLIGLAVDNDLSTPATLSRVCRPDPTGTLYIGKSNWLNERANKLRRRRGRHNAIETLGHTPLGKLFPPNKLAIGLLFTKVGMPRLIEGQLIRAYMNSFGDTPPLNVRL